MSLKGLRITKMPQFKKKNKVGDDGKYKGQRIITNWWYQEVPADYKPAAKRGRKPQDK